MKTTRCMCGAIGAGFGLLLACAAMADTVYLRNGKSSIPAKSITWRESAQEYRVETMDNMTLTFQRNQVARLDITKPADIDRAQQMIASGQPDAAITVLNDVIEKYRMRNWDNVARELLATIYLQRKDPKKAIALLEDYFRAAGQSEGQAKLRKVYWIALNEAERFSTLKKELDTVIINGPRDAAAEAQIMRGDMARKQGSKEDAFKDYMRTALLFKDVKSVQPEALFKAAEILDEMRDPRGDLLRKEIVAEHPESEYAKKLRGKV